MVDTGWDVSLKVSRLVNEEGNLPWKFRQKRHQEV